MTRHRLACAQVPLFPLAARLRSEPDLRDEAVAVLAGHGDAARVVAATKRARRAGVRAGFTLAQARARLPKLIARPQDEECERAAQEALLDVAESFSPRIEDAGDGTVYLDVDGLDRHYRPRDGDGDDGGAELALGREMVLAFEQRAGLLARVGFASSKLAAHMAAQQPDSPAIVDAGREAEFLAPLPLARLTPQASTLGTLEQWGIHSLGDFARLPASEVISRLGPAGEVLHAIARGEDPKPLVPRTPPPAYREGLELDWPLVNLEPFLFTARAALERLVGRMQRRGLGCHRLELSLDLEGDGHHERSLTLPAPTRDLKTLLTLVRLDLEAHPPGAPILAFRFTAHPDQPRSAQMSLFGPEALSPDKLATTLARLFALLGPDRVGSPRPVDGHLPERSDLVPYAPPPPPRERPTPQSGCGLLAVRVLRPPVPVEVMVTGNAPADAPPPSDPDPAAHPAPSRPLSVKSLLGEETRRRPKIQGAVRVASGPWGLEEGWWQENPTTRDYWDVELSSGGLYRLFRERTSGDWFVDGVYD
ncbi:MAG: DNA polymerase Y family protein [Acidobacteriota bacterium]